MFSSGESPDASSSEASDASEASGGSSSSVLNCAVSILKSLSANAARIHFAEAQTNAVLVRINANHAQAFDLTFLEHFLRMLDAMLGNLGNMDESFDIAFEAGKSAELGQTSDNTFDQLTDAIFFNTRSPGVALQSTDGKPDALLLRGPR